MDLITSNTLEISTNIEIAGKQIDQVRTAINNGDYSALKHLLLNQAVTLHHLGNQFVLKAEEHQAAVTQRECINVAVRCYTQSQKTMAAIKQLEPSQPKDPKPDS